MTQDNYDKYRQKFRDLLDLSDKALDKALSGRKKYCPRCLRPLPFEGISVIHNIDHERAVRKYTADGELLRPAANHESECRTDEAAGPDDHDLIYISGIHGSTRLPSVTSWNLPFISSGHCGKKAEKGQRESAGACR